MASNTDMTLRYRQVKRSLAQLMMCALLSFALLSVCTRSSSLYALNNWDDANSYFTVGKSMMRGLTPYRDLFDQKGILLYFIYGIASLISYRTFAGVFIMELIAATFNLFAIYKTLLLFVKRPYAAASLPVLGAAIYSSRAMWWGGSAEEFLLPFLAWGLYFSMSYFRRTYPEPVSYRVMMLSGVLAGCVFLIKFNSLGFYIGFVPMMLYADLLGNRKVIGPLRRVQLSFYSLLYFLLGFLLPIVPFTVYFIIRHGIYDWYYVYIYCNLFVYSNPMSFGDRIYRVCKVLYSHAGHNPLYFALLMSGGLYWLISRNRRLVEKINVLVSGFFLVFFIFIGGVDLPYYPLPLSVFSVLGAIFICEMRQRAAARYHDKKLRRDEQDLSRFSDAIIPVSLTLSVALSAAICAAQSLNISYLDVKKNDAWQLEFADIINDSGIDDPTLINVSCFDAGLYTSTGIIPNCRFFQTQTIHLDDVYETQHKFVSEGACDFVLTRDVKEPDGINNHYTLIAERKQQLKDFEHVYYLYGKTDRY